MQFEDRANAVAKFGFTLRQARFLVTVMLHSGVCLRRQYATFAGIVLGEKTRRFFAKLVRLRYASAYPCRHNRGHVYQVHHKGLYRAIGETDSRHRRPLSATRVVENLMLLDAVLAEPNLVWLATDHDKAVHLTALTPIDEARLPLLGIGKRATKGRPALVGKFPIGIDLRGRALLVYLATDGELGRFRAFVRRNFEVLQNLPAWTMRIVVPPWPEGLGGRYEAVAREELTRTVRPVVIDELRWYFEERRKLASGNYETPNQERFDYAEHGFQAPRFQALYPHWVTVGEAAFDIVSTSLNDAVQRGAGRIECVVLPHSYRHLSPLVGATTRQQRGAEEGDETPSPPRPRATACAIAAPAIEITRTNRQSTNPEVPAQ
jgi:hypothetical protein